MGLGTALGAEKYLRCVFSSLPPKRPVARVIGFGFPIDTRARECVTLHLSPGALFLVATPEQAPNLPPAKTILGRVTPQGLAAGNLLLLRSHTGRGRAGGFSAF